MQHPPCGGDSQETVTANLRDMMDDARREYLDPIMTPLMVAEFIRVCWRRGEVGVRFCLD